MKFTGETDKILKIKLPSAILIARWGANEVAVNGRVMLEVQTAWVSDDSDILIKVKDAEGNVIESISGKIYYNFFRTQYLVSKPNKTGGMFFEAEMKAHGLKAVSHRVKVWPVVQITDLKWLDEKGTILKEVAEEQIVELTGKIAGPTNGTAGYLSVICKKSENSEASIATIPFKVESGKMSAKWRLNIPEGPAGIAKNSDLQKVGLKYFQPLFSFEASCLGIMGKSFDVKLISWIEYKFGPPPSAGVKRTAVFELPDGTTKKETVPENGMVKFAITQPGTVVYKTMEI